MPTSTTDRTDVFLRFSRRQLFALLAIVLVLGAVAVGLTMSPPGAVRSPGNLPYWLAPVLLALAIAVAGAIGGRRWDPNSPEVRAVAQDEWRQRSMDRASRTALVTLIAIQWPLGLLVGHLAELPPPRAAMAMAAWSITLGLGAWIALFLMFDRE